MKDRTLTRLGLTGIAIGAVLFADWALTRHSQPDNAAHTGQPAAQMHVATAPGSPKRIADLWYAHNEMLVMLGAAPQIAMTVETPRMSPWMFRLAPQMQHAVHVESGGPTPEALLAAHIDTVFATPGSIPRAGYERLGIRVITVHYDNTRGLLRGLDRTADALGTPLAQKRARAYRAYLEQREAFLAKRLANVPQNARPKVLHVMSLSPLTVDGGNTMIDEWIRLAGGRDVASGLQGGRKPVSIEQVATWAPDIIIVGAQVSQADLEKAGPVWKQLAAVRAGRVFRNPAGIFDWDRYGTEFALQLDWAAKRFHPKLFPDLALESETIYFYHRFFGIDLKPEQARRILNALPPA